MLPSRLKRTLVAAAMAPALAIPAAVLAENSAQQQQTRAQQQQMQVQPGDMRVTRLQGMQVQNAQGEGIGEVKDVVIDARSGKVAYVALSHGGFLGVGEELFAYPLSQFRMGEHANELVLTARVTEEQLEEREGFNDDDWPRLREDRDYWAAVDEDFGQDSASAGASGQPAAQARAFVRASELVGEPVHDRSDNKVGEIEDLVISPSDGDVRFAVVDTAGDDDLVPVPIDALSVRHDGSDTVLRYERDRMDLSQAFEADEWPL